MYTYPSRVPFLKPRSFPMLNPHNVTLAKRFTALALLGSVVAVAAWPVCVWAGWGPSPLALVVALAAVYVMMVYPISYLRGWQGDAHLGPMAFAHNVAFALFAVASFLWWLVGAGLVPAENVTAASAISPGMVTVGVVLELLVLAALWQKALSPTAAPSPN
jgi:hypothetical protein